MTVPRLGARACSPTPLYHPVMGALAPVPRICGREAEIQALGEALGRVASGGPAIVLVEGEAGIGKTRLLAQALEDARGRGMQVAAGRAEELERTRPFGVLAAAFGCARSSPDPRRAAIARLLASQGAGDQGPITVTSDPGLRFRVVDAFTDLAEELALAGPLVIGLDDLQWADPSSLLTVGALARRLTDLPVGLIGCLRPSPRAAELDRLAGALGAVGARHLILLAEAIRAGVLEDDGARLRFRHELIRDAIYEDLAGSVRRALHREAGQRLAQAGAPALQVAEHLARGATTGDTDAVAWLARAARQAAPRSPDVAADLLDRAAGLMAAADPGRDGLLAEWASSLMRAGRIGDAEAACRLLLGRDLDPSLEDTVRVCLGHALLAGGRARDGLCELERACESPLLTGAERAEAQAWASLARLVLADLGGAAAAAEEARSAAVAARDPLATSVALGSLALVSELRGDLRDALKIIDDAVRLADESPGRLGHRFPLHDFRGSILTALDRLDEARSTLPDGDMQITATIDAGRR
jgi:tetratricopeptide (TPR) repeat protein